MAGFTLLIIFQLNYNSSPPFLSRYSLFDDIPKTKPKQFFSLSVIIVLFYTVARWSNRLGIQAHTQSDVELTCSIVFSHNHRNSTCKIVDYFFLVNVIMLFAYVVWSHMDKIAHILYSHSHTCTLTSHKNLNVSPSFRLPVPLKRRQTAYDTITDDIMPNMPNTSFSKIRWLSCCCCCYRF